MPGLVAALPRHLRAHAADAIDFTALRGKRVAVLGPGASAFDNAATALEAGAAQEHLFCRRAEPMISQPCRWLTFAGFLRRMHEMDDASRWRFTSYILGLREGFPPDTYARVLAFANFTMHLGRTWTRARQLGSGVVLETPRGSFEADYVICGTGARMDASASPLLAGCADNIASWSDRYTPPEAEADERLGAFPDPAADSSFVERHAGETPWLRDIDLFGIGTTRSFGPAAPRSTRWALPRRGSTPICWPMRLHR
jgi:cation diffusion facilitator CzcD-associated flavoprotein CzcO